MDVKLKERVTEDMIFNLKNRLAVIRQRLLEKGDTQSGEKLWQLINKVENQEFSIGFCGHFSAGKSSMINKLWDEELLPSSPIPTSANVVKVRAGEPWARVYFKNRNPIQFDYLYDINKVKAYCLDGDEVDSVEISHPSEEFPNQVVLLDTPGIDSTDDAHRIATTSSLHLADVVFYVMDYNHVQSELNFHFAKEIKEQGKRLYFVINQIDKHHDTELSFHQFQQGVKAAFDHWNIEPDGIFYTSLLKQLEWNEWNELKQFIDSLIEDKDKYFLDHIQKATMTIIDEHLEWLKTEHESEREQLASTFENLTDTEVQQAKTEYEFAQKRKQEIEGILENFEKELKSEIGSILDNAILMPFETRELAKQYLEAMEEKFKVGFLFSKNKTEEERERRTQAFYKNLMEKVTSQLDWHCKQALVELAKQHGINNQELFTSILNKEIHVPISILSEQRKTGAVVNGDYLLKYAEDVANEMKRIYRLFAEEMKVTLMADLERYVRSEHEKIDDILGKNEKIVQVLKEETEFQQVVQHINSELHSLLLEEVTLSPDDVEVALANLPTEQEVTIVHDEELHDLNEKSEELTESNRQEQRNVPNEDDTPDLEATIRQLKEVSREVGQIKELGTVAEELKERAIRLENKRFTVALFGAFSAGKSSFANALIGQSVLPVSPNPTTATINKIVPIDNQHPHGTVIVKMKSEADLLDDLNASLKLFHKEIDSLQAVEKKISTLNSNNMQPKAKPHYAFLKAVVKGIQFYRERAGKELVISLEEFQSFVAQEEKACFVEWIELYYDCPLTRQGITLVDTPGADSINARHTGVAFEYIKNADAILFVTYYNHAFSQADQEFLKQLGRVKDVFELDKMFFIVNAADLAKSEEELSLVISHVEDNLLQNQIRQPRIFPISSQVALLSRLGIDGKLEAEQHERLKSLLQTQEIEEQSFYQKGLEISKIESFEQAFYQFIHIELTGTALTAANTEISRTMETLRDWIKSAKQGERERKQQIEQTKQIWDKIVTFIRSLQPTTERQALIQEMEELFYYVKERLFLRFKERFQQSFNPAVLQSGERSMKENLKASTHELVDSIGFDLVQEMRATSLRIEAFLQKRMLDVFNDMEKNIHELATAEFLHAFEFEKVDSPEIEERFYTINIQQLYPLLSIFKNPKQFFEQNGQDEMREAFEQAFQKPVEEYLQTSLEQFKQHYETVFSNSVERLQTELEKETSDYFEGKLAVLSAYVDLHLLETTYSKIKENLT